MITWDYFLPKQRTKLAMLLGTNVIGEVEHITSVLHTLDAHFLRPMYCYVIQSSILLWKEAVEMALFVCCPRQTCP